MQGSKTGHPLGRPQAGMITMTKPGTSYIGKKELNLARKGEGQGFLFLSRGQAEKPGM